MRSDLPHGLQAAQAVHAAQQWQAEDPAEFAVWRRESNTVVIVSVPNAAGLEAMAGQARSVGVPVSAFYDDALSPQLTSLALGPGEGARSLCCQLPLAMKEVSRYRDD